MDQAARPDLEAIHGRITEDEANRLSELFFDEARAEQCHDDRVALYYYAIALGDELAAIKADKREKCGPFPAPDEPQ